MLLCGSQQQVEAADCAGLQQLCALLTLAACGASSPQQQHPLCGIATCVGSGMFCCWLVDEGFCVDMLVGSFHHLSRFVYGGAGTISCILLYRRGS